MSFPPALLSLLTPLISSTCPEFAFRMGYLGIGSSQPTDSQDMCCPDTSWWSTVGYFHSMRLPNQHTSSPRKNKSPHSVPNRSADIQLSRKA